MPEDHTPPGADEENLGAESPSSSCERWLGPGIKRARRFRRCDDDAHEVLLRLYGGLENRAQMNWIESLRPVRVREDSGRMISGWRCGSGVPPSPLVLGQNIHFK